MPLIFTARVAKLAKVMFSQVFVILSPNGGGRRWTTLVVNHLPTPVGPGQNIYPLPLPLGPSQNIYPLPPWDQVRTSTPSPPPPGTKSEHLPPPPSWDQVWTSTPPLGPSQNIYPLTPPPGTKSEHLPLPPPGTKSEHLPPPPLGPSQDIYPLPPSSWDQVRTSAPSPLLGPGLQTLCRPRANLVQTSCQNLVQTSCRPHADLMQTSCQTSCRPRANLLGRPHAKLVIIFHRSSLDLDDIYPPLI